MARDSCARRRFIGWRTLISQNKAKKNLRSLPPNLTIAVIRGKNLECNRAENGCKINKWSCKRSLEGSSAILTSSRQVRISFSLGSLAKAAATSCPSKSSAAPWGHPPISGSLELRTPGCQLKGWIWIGCYQILRNQSPAKTATLPVQCELGAIRYSAYMSTLEPVLHTRANIPP